MKKRIFVILSIALFFMYSGFLPNILRIANNIGIISNMEYLSQYGQRATNWGFLITFLGIFLLVGACWLKTDSIKDESADFKQDVLRQFIITVLLLLPLLFMNWAYDRLARVYMLLMYVYFVNRPKSHVITPKQAVSYICYFSSIAYFYYIDISSVYEGTLGAILKYNKLF